jgi:Sulfotransferase family
MSTTNEHRMDPVFLLSPGRSGSTLLQRYLNCGKDLILWGEHGGFLSGLRNTYQNWSENKNTQSLFKRGTVHSDLLLSSKVAVGVDIEWTNNFSPDHFKHQLTNLIVELFTVDIPPQTRWGFKEIRYDDKDINFLKDLFPLAQFVFIVRDPIDTLASAIVAFAKAAQLWEAVEQATDERNKMKTQLEIHSNRTLNIAKGIVNCTEKDMGYLIKYEDLRDNPIESVQRICQYLKCCTPDPEQIKLIAGDVRRGTNTKIVKQRIRQDFLGEQYVQDLLGVYKFFGYGQSIAH